MNYSLEAWHFYWGVVFLSGSVLFLLLFLIYQCLNVACLQSSFFVTEDLHSSWNHVRHLSSRGVPWLINSSSYLLLKTHKRSQWGSFSVTEQLTKLRQSLATAGHISFLQLQQICRKCFKSPRHQHNCETTKKWLHVFIWRHLHQHVSNFTAYRKFQCYSELHILLYSLRPSLPRRAWESW